MVNAERPSDQRARRNFQAFVSGGDHSGARERFRLKLLIAAQSDIAEG